MNEATKNAGYSWTTDDVDFLEQNWVLPQNWEVLKARLQRSQNAIYNKARALGLPLYSRVEARLENGREKVEKVAELFLVHYKEERRLWPALNRSKLAKSAYDRLYEKNPEFKKRVDEISDFFAATIKCGSCHVVFDKGVKFCSVSDSGKFGTCAACKAKRRKELDHSSFEHRLASILSNCRNRSKIKGQEIDIDMLFLKELFKKQNGRCYYSGEELEFDCDKRDHNLISIDRKNSAIGYLKSNVVFCTWFVNSVKSTLTEDQFVRVCTEVARFRKVG